MFQVAEKQTGTPTALDLGPVLGYLLAGSLILLAMALVALVAWRRSQLKGPSRPIALPLKDKVSLPLRSDPDDLYELEDKNPDVVPCNKGKTKVGQLLSALVANVVDTCQLPWRPQKVSPTFRSRALKII